MTKRREIVEGILFLPAMAALAVVVFAVFWLIGKFGNAVMYGWFWLLAGLGIPRPAALALGVILTAATVPLTLKYLIYGRR